MLFLYLISCKIFCTFPFFEKNKSDVAASICALPHNFFSTGLLTVSTKFVKGKCKIHSVHI